MHLKNQIDQIFSLDACGDVLLYRFPGGLRFESSESGTPLEQVLTPLRKATAISLPPDSDRRAKVGFGRGKAPRISSWTSAIRGRKPIAASDRPSFDRSGHFR